VPRVLSSKNQRFTAGIGNSDYKQALRLDYRKEQIAARLQTLNVKENRAQVSQVNRVGNTGQLLPKTKRLNICSLRKANRL
jgi:hypothetical protein